MDHEALAPKELVMPQVKEPSREDPVVLQDSPLGYADRAPRALARRRRFKIHRTPPALVDEPYDQQYHLERILQQRRRDGQYQYLVQKRRYPELENSWEYEVPLRQDFPYAVDVFERRIQGLSTHTASH
uniref:Chromo domain-containing protein n=1 Tax=Peronospora matthiolae TaxID=2874970 RepID=A0AAV1U905_9STRA